MISTSPKLFVVFVLFYQFSDIFCTICQIEEGVFNSPGAQMFDTIYTSGNVSLYYKMHIPQHINLKANNYDKTTNTPVLVMVHGSGPQNHDEEIQVEGTPGYYTFRDIAHGLCRDYGIIVFTYDKRSCGLAAPVPCLNNLPRWCIFFPDEIPCFNVTKLTYLDFVSDAIYAVKYLQGYASINPSNIIPTGHSQGASIVPFVSSYMGLSTSISLMGAGVPIDKVLIYQEEALNYSQTLIDHDILTFKMIRNGSLSGWDTVNILNVSGSAIFWKQWIDYEMNTSRLTDLRNINNILTINSDTDFNVPPFAYEPLHKLINQIAGNISYKLHASMNVLPYMIHQMVYIDNVIQNRLNVTNDVISLIGEWLNQIYGNVIDNISSNSDNNNSTGDIILGIFIGLFTMIFICGVIALILVKGCGYKMCQKNQTNYTAF